MKKSQMSHKPRRKQRGIKFETLKGTGYLTLAAVAKCLQAATRLVTRENKWSVMLLSAVLLCAGCSRPQTEEAAEIMQQDKTAEKQDLSDGEMQGQDLEVEMEETTGIAYESAEDTGVDFTVLKAENPDIYAWIYIPGTNIDAPVLQSTEADDYYESHNAYGEVSEEGALYTELANLKDMCDFNTVIHGKSSSDDTEGLFTDLYHFADSEFFENHEDVYLYLEDNLLTYTVFAAYERENTSLIRTYDFTYGSGCEQFLDEVYGIREMGKNIRDGWEEVTPYHFLITLTTPSRTDPDKQFVVIAALVSDAAGKIDRTVEW